MFNLCLTESGDSLSTVLQAVPPGSVFVLCMRQVFSAAGPFCQSQPEAKPPQVEKTPGDSCGWSVAAPSPVTASLWPVRLAWWLLVRPDQFFVYFLAYPLSPVSCPAVQPLLYVVASSWIRTHTCPQCGVLGLLGVCLHDSEEANVSVWNHCSFKLSLLYLSIPCCFSHGEFS